MTRQLRLLSFTYVKETEGYGFRTFRATELALYHVLGKLPEPKLAHSFY